MRKAISCYIFKSGNGDCSNNGISARYTEVLVEHPRGYVEFDENNPPENLVVIDKKNFSFGSYINAKPVCIKGHSMMGGTFIYSSDARFTDFSDYPIPLHDRVE